MRIYAVCMYICANSTSRTLGDACAAEAVVRESKLKSSEPLYRVMPLMLQMGRSFQLLGATNEMEVAMARLLVRLAEL